MTQVAHFCTFPHGGAATAAKRLHQTLNDSSQSSGIASRFYYYRNQNSVELDASFDQIEFQPETFRGLSGALARRRYKRRQNRIYDSYNRYLAIRPQHAETYSMAELPEPTKLDWENIGADVAHLHWISFFADYPSFFSSIPTTVPIVWSLHDTNAFTGGCHYTNGCQQFRFGCGSCPQLVNRDQRDVSRSTFQAKQKALAGRKIHVVAPCDWMLSEAQSSPIWPTNTTFEKIEYGLNLSSDYPAPSSDDQQQARIRLGLDPDKQYLAFGAMDVDNPRKGIQYLLPALQHLAASDLAGTHEIECLAFGSGEFATAASLPTINHLGFIDSLDRKRDVYLAADLVVVPSVEDNQPQVGLEAMACGTPVIAFDSTGMPEYVRPNETGALARLADSDHLAEVMLRLLSSPEQLRSLGRNARTLIETRFNHLVQREKWFECYASVMLSASSRRSRKAA